MGGNFNQEKIENNYENLGILIAVPLVTLLVLCGLYDELLLFSVTTCRYVYGKRCGCPAVLFQKPTNPEFDPLAVPEPSFLRLSDQFAEAGFKPGGEAVKDRVFSLRPKERHRKVSSVPSGEQQSLKSTPG